MDIIIKTTGLTKEQIEKL
jgi:hypothetical protein